MTVCQYLVARVQLSECVQTLLQLCDHAAWKFPALGDLLAEGVVVLNQTQNMAAITISPHPVAWHQARRCTRNTVSWAAADRPAFHIRVSKVFLIWAKEYPGIFETESDAGLWIMFFLLTIMPQKMFSYHGGHWCICCDSEKSNDVDHSPHALVTCLLHLRQMWNQHWCDTCVYTCVYLSQIGSVCLPGEDSR